MEMRFYMGNAQSCKCDLSPLDTGQEKTLGGNEGSFTFLTV